MRDVKRHVWHDSKKPSFHFSVLQVSATGADFSHADGVNGLWLFPFAEFLKRTWHADRCKQRPIALTRQGSRHRLQANGRFALLFIYTLLAMVIMWCFFLGHPTRDTRRDDNPQEPLLGRSRSVTPGSHGCRKFIHKLWVRVRAPQEGFDSIRLWLTVICFVNLGALLRILRLVVRTCICHYETTWADEWSGTGWRHPRTFSHNKSVAFVRVSESQLLRCSPHNGARSAAACIHSIPWCHPAKRGGMGWGGGLTPTRYVSVQIPHWTPCVC